MSASHKVFHFGAFTLHPASRLLLENGQPVRLGARALDLLVALVEQSGEVIAKEDLFKRVWPNTVVEETSLRVHIAALRKALGGADARYIANIPGKGYSFTGELEMRAPAAPPAAAPVPRLARHNLPVRLTKMIGRSAAAEAVSTLLLTRRFVTIVGEGGVGKTTLALAVAEGNLGEYADGTSFVDLATCSHEGEVVSAVGRALGLPLPPHSPATALCDALKHQRFLLVLDNCEHLISASAELAVDLLQRLPILRILATSREPLRAEGEHVHRLDTLPVPPAGQTATLAQAMQYESIQLLVERVSAVADGFEIADHNIAHAAEPCRRLDGIPLALELAAARVSFFGLAGLLDRLHERLSLLTSGHRTVMPRHQTLRALYDWSFDLLDAASKRAFCRLAVFPGSFPLEGGLALMPGDDRAEALTTFLELISKSLLTTNLGTARRTYSLLDTARVYAAEKLGISGEAHAARSHHAAWVIQTLNAANKEWSVLERRVWSQRHAYLVEDASAALAWAASEPGERLLYGELTAASYLLHQELSQLEPHRPHLRAALGGLRQLAERRLDLEQHLTVLLGEALAHCKTQWRDVEEWREEANASFSDAELHPAVLYCASVAALSHGEYRQMLRSSERLEYAAEARNEPNFVVAARRLQAQAHHFLGEHGTARRLAEDVLLSSASGAATSGKFDTMDRRVSMGIVLARLSWLQGNSEEAWRVLQAIADLAAKEFEHGRCQYLALAAIPIAVWEGDMGAARNGLNILMQMTDRPGYSDYWREWASALSRVVAGEPLNAPLSSAKLADLIGALDPTYEDGRLLDRAESGLAGWSASEVLRHRAERIRTEVPLEAERLLGTALAMARHQGAVRWELRCALSLARLSLQRQQLLVNEQSILGPLAKLVVRGDDPDARLAPALTRSLAQLRVALNG